MKLLVFILSIFALSPNLFAANQDDLFKFAIQDEFPEATNIQFGITGPLLALSNTLMEIQWIPKMVAGEMARDYEVGYLVDFDMPGNDGIPVHLQCDISRASETKESRDVEIGLGGCGAANEGQMFLNIFFGKDTGPRFIKNLKLDENLQDPQVQWTQVPN